MCLLCLLMGNMERWGILSLHAGMEEAEPDLVNWPE